MREETLRKLVGIPVFLFGVIYLIPFLYAVISSLKTMEELYMNPLSLPKVVAFENYIRIWTETRLPTAFLNSTLISALSIVLTLIASAPAAYSLTRWRFKGDRFLFSFIALGLMVPWPAFMFAILTIMRNLGLMNNLFSAVILYAAFNMPFSLMVLTAFFKSIPKEYQESAIIDGASEVEILRRIYLPLSTPIIVTLSVIIFSNCWNEFMYALVLLQKPEVRTVPVALLDIMMQYSVQTNLVLAAAVLSTIIPLAIFLLFYRRIVEGLTSGLKF